MRHWSITSKTLVALILAAAFGGFAAIAMQAALQSPARAAVPVTPALGALPATVGGQPLPSLAPMLERVTPAVVSVHAKQRVRVSPFANDPVFRRMFPGLSQERINKSLGSGVIIDAARGLVLTNHHVIAGADEVSVTLNDGRTLPAKLVGSDPQTDVALMQIPAEDLHALPLADSSSLRVGDFVVAVGNPFGLGQTVTSGIVSAVGRSGLAGLGLQNFIQTDASINPGNSGGALVNLRGELVGINTASFNPQGSMAGNIGLGFAIPSNLAGRVMEQLISHGEVRRGRLGLRTRKVTARVAAALDLVDARGALVTHVFSGSAAAEAGIVAGDVVVAAGDKRIDSPAELRNFEGLQAIGSQAELTVLRNGQTVHVTTAIRQPPTSFPGAKLDPRLAGATFSRLPERLRVAGVDGVLVSAVASNSRAAHNGLREGDLVIAASTGRFGALAGFRAGFTRAPAQLVLRVVRGNRRSDLLMQ